jgi:hypothetical protein
VREVGGVTREEQETRQTNSEGRGGDGGVRGDMLGLLPHASCLLRPALLTEGHLLAGLLSAAIDLTLPRPVFAQSLLGVVGVIKVNLRDLGLDKSPYTPMNKNSISTSSFRRLP